MKVILLPGLDGTGLLFTPFKEVLGSSIDASVVSYPSDRFLGYEELADFVIEQLPEEDFILIGESFSGPVAYKIALRKPENLKAVIFVATFLHNPSKFFLNPITIFLLKYLLLLPLPTLLIKFFFVGKEASNQLLHLFKLTVPKVSTATMFFRLQEIYRLPKKIQTCGINATYIQASNDHLVPKSCLDAFCNAFIDLDVYRVKGPHLIMQSNPLICAEILADKIRLITKKWN